MDTDFRNDGTPREYANARQEFVNRLVELARTDKFTRFHPTCDLNLVILLRQGVVTDVFVEPRTKIKCGPAPDTSRE